MIWLRMRNEVANALTSPFFASVLKCLLMSLMVTISL